MQYSESEIQLLIISDMYVIHLQLSPTRSVINEQFAHTKTAHRTAAEDTTCYSSDMHAGAYNTALTAE